MCLVSHAASRRLAPCAAEWNSRRALFSVVLGVSRSCKYNACSARWNAKRMFIKRWMGDSVALGLSEGTAASEECSEPGCVGVMVANDEREG